MNEEGFRVRCSKLWAICLAFGWGIIGGACAITILVFAIIGIISPDEEFEKYFGRRADKRRKLYNGMIKCQYYMYFK